MESFKERFLRPCRKFTDIAPIAMVQAFGIMILATLFQLIGNRFLVQPYLPSVASTDPALSFAGHYLSFIYIWPATALCILIPKANRRMLRDILPNKRGNTIVGILLGILGGFGVNALCILISLLLKDVGLEFSTFQPLSLLFLFASVFVQSGAEEIVTRLFLYEKLRRRYRSPWVAIILNASLFGALHLANPGASFAPIAQCILVGFLFSLFVYYFDSLWAAMFFHTSWNFTQSILFGCPNSGIVSEYSLFRLTGASTGPFFDATFGVEGGIGSVILIAVIAVVVIVYGEKNGLPKQDLWAEEEERVSEPTPATTAAPAAPTAPAAPKAKHMRHNNNG